MERKSKKNGMDMRECEKRDESHTEFFLKKRWRLVFKGEGEKWKNGRKKKQESKAKGPFNTPIPDQAQTKPSSQ